MNEQGKLQNIAMVIEYDGSNFYGFQKQPGNARTIQSVFEQAILKFTNIPAKIITAGRTDAGVHATHQVINFTTPIMRELHKWQVGVNALLPDDIVIKKVAFVPDTFNARYDAISRTYSYYLLSSPIRPAILYKKVGWYYKPLDLAKMQQASQLLLGQHDFSSFRASNCQALTAIRNVIHSSVTQHTAWHPDIICITITANAFLYHMVRNIVGALVYVGNGKISIEEFSDLIKVCDRKLAPPTFMADGLYFAKAEYKVNPFVPYNL